MAFFESHAPLIALRSFQILEKGMSLPSRVVDPKIGDLGRADAIEQKEKSALIGRTYGIMGQQTFN
jgi:hypothetical protein